MPVYAPISGYVTGRTAYHGMKVMPADTLFDILDLSAVWVLADVYEYELPAPRARAEGDDDALLLAGSLVGRARSRTSTRPSTRRRARSRCASELGNPKGELKPEMFADVTIHGPTRGPSSRCRTTRFSKAARGTSSSCPQGEGKFVPREITLGDHGSGMVEVLTA